MNPEVLQKIKQIPQTGVFHLVFLLAISLAGNATATGINEQLAQKIISMNGVTYKDTSKYIRKNIEGKSGRVRLLDANTTEVLGISSFAKTNTNDDELFIFNRIAVNYKVDAAENKEALLLYNDELPAALRNAVLVVTVSKKEKFRLPISDLNNIANSAVATKDLYYEFSSYQYWGDGKEITIDLELPDGGTISNGGSFGYVEVVFKGHALS